MSGPAAAGLDGKLGFTITVPASWYELDLQPGTRETSIRTLVEERVRGNDTMWEQRHAIHKLLVQQSADAWDAGATYCAGFSLPTEEGPITGSLTISLIEDPLLGTGAQAEDLFAQVPPTSDPLAPYALTTVAEIPTAGACPRSSGIEDSPFPGGGLVRHVFMVTAAHVREHGRVFLVTCSSPVLPLAEELLDLFDAVTGTFRVVRRDDPSED